MLELLQEILCFMEQHEKCKECVRMMTEDELRRKHKLEMNISSIIIEQLKENYCIGETTFPENKDFIFEVSEINDAPSESEQIPSTKPMEENGGENAVVWCNNEDSVETVEEDVEESVDDSHKLIFKEPMEKETETLENKTEDVILECNNCPEGTPTKINENLLVCLFCNKTFLTKFDVEKHTCPENVQATHKCTHCSWRYVNEEDLKTHMAVHEKQKPFKCNYCYLCFLTKRHRSLHENVHKIKVKEYPCDGCDLIFQSKHHLRIHSKEKHNILVYKRGSECVAPDCSNNPNNSCTKPKRSFHVFPTNPNRFKQWVDNIQKIYPNFQPPRQRKNTWLCSDHFTKDCYENKTSINEFCNFRMRNKLKQSAIPTVFNV